MCDCFCEKGPNAYFSSFQMFRYSRSPLHIASYALRIEVSVMKLLGAEFLISHTFQCKHYISIAYNVCTRSHLAEMIPYVVSEKD